jgi:hypothetical protein
MVIVFPYGTCAICDSGLPPGSSRKQRVICDHPECKREAGRYGARILNIRMARRRAATPPPVERRCPQCGEVKPLDADHFYLNARPGSAPSRRLDRWCKDCRRRKAAEMRARNRDSMNARKAQRREEIRASWTPEQWEAERTLKRESARRSRARDPERIKANQRASRARVKTDPERLRKLRESRRIAYRLRAEREGRQVRTKHAERDRDEIELNMRRLPAGPLAEAVQHHVARLQRDHGNDGLWSREAILERLGTTERTVFAWLRGERDTVNWDTADTILTRCDLLALDVWDDPAVLALWGMD